MSKVRKVVVPAQVKATGMRTFETTITTRAVDRERDTIDPAGWKLDNYLKAGAPVLWAHDYKLPPIAKSLEIRRTATGLVSVDLFPPVGVFPFADQVHDFVAAGMTRAKSVPPWWGSCGSSNKRGSILNGILHFRGLRSSA